MNNQYSPNYTAVQIALSTNCNLLCPGCQRTAWDSPRKLNPLITKNIFLDKQILLDVIQNKASNSLEKIEFVGLIDDALTYPWLLELLQEMLNVRPDLNIEFDTNASLRTPDYFKKLANILNKFPKHFVNFSVDGLEDTNHIYRVGANWKKIMGNAEAFIQAGGRANWQFIVFPWNAHQEKKIKKLAKTMGFDNIVVRHNQDLSLNTPQMAKDKPWLKESKTNEKYVGTSFKVFDTILKKDKYFPPYNIDCLWHGDQKIYISYTGNVWPCCFIAYDPLRRPELLNARFSSHGENFNSLYHHTIDEIMSKEPFSSDILNSINNNKKHGIGQSDTYYTCIRSCSTRGFEEIPSHHTHKATNYSHKQWMQLLLIIESWNGKPWTRKLLTKLKKYLK